jgi:hypothetical protein
MGAGSPDFYDVHHKQEKLDMGTINHPWVVGANYIIRTVTMTNTGKLLAVYEHELVLMDAAWIADTGRWHSVLKVSEFNEVEPFPAGKEVIIGRSAVIDAVQIDKLPRTQK